MARVGLRYAWIGHSVSLVWPPTGIAIAALTMLGYRYWPGVAVGAFLANESTPVPLLAAAGIAAGNTLAAAAAGALVSAVMGASVLWMAGQIPRPDLPETIAVWWTGDLLGALVVAPVLLAWGASREARAIPRGMTMLLEQLLEPLL